MAAPGAFTRFTGGRTRADCALVTDVAGAGRTGAVVATCTDGDPACDADATADGRCTFAVRLCFEAALAGCPDDPVTHAELRDPSPVLDGLVAALSLMTMPVTTPETCTSTATVPVSTNGHRRGRMVLRGMAVMASGHADRDRLVLACRTTVRRVRVVPATFATIQRQVFARSCTSSSCHGAASAGGLGLAGGAAYGNLVGTLASNPAARAAGVLRVAPGDPAHSFLLHKLTGPLADAEGELMPRVGIRLPSSRIDLVRRWIAAGAPADGSF